MSRPRNRNLFRHTSKASDALSHGDGSVRRHCGRGMPRPSEGTGPLTACARGSTARPAPGPSSPSCLPAFLSGHLHDLYGNQHVPSKARRRSSCRVAASFAGQRPGEGVGLLSAPRTRRSYQAAAFGQTHPSPQLQAVDSLAVPRFPVPQALGQSPVRSVGLVVRPLPRPKSSHAPDRDSVSAVSRPFSHNACSFRVSGAGICGLETALPLVVDHRGSSGAIALTHQRDTCPAESTLPTSRERST